VSALLVRCGRICTRFIKRPTFHLSDWLLGQCTVSVDDRSRSMPLAALKNVSAVLLIVHSPYRSLCICPARGSNFVSCDGRQQNEQRLGSSLISSGGPMTSSSMKKNRPVAEISKMLGNAPSGSCTSIFWNQIAACCVGFVINTSSGPLGASLSSWLSSFIRLLVTADRVIQSVQLSPVPRTTANNTLEVELFIQADHFLMRFR